MDDYVFLLYYTYPIASIYQFWSEENRSGESSCMRAIHNKKNKETEQLPWKGHRIDLAVVTSIARLEV